MATGVNDMISTALSAIHNEIESGDEFQSATDGLYRGFQPQDSLRSWTVNVSLA